MVEIIEIKGTETEKEEEERERNIRGDSKNHVIQPPLLVYCKTMS